eukprot:CAMPEP_0170511394 /NCGR_PEP_ID=MMETSP0208-20121228/66284_1 /TAXON_ID=197538 /ORGANISM="Strombidium inclinatum, Strain S3" /LENGTH=47 /DNA_ID= /DNA_START= /DNA_END= /DNA_ORIENTATION=
MARHCEYFGFLSDVVLIQKFEDAPAALVAVHERHAAVGEDDSVVANP